MGNVSLPSSQDHHLRSIFVPNDLFCKFSIQFQIHLESEMLHCGPFPWKQPFNRVHVKFIFLAIIKILLIYENFKNTLQLNKWTFCPHSYNLVFNNNGSLCLTIPLNEFPHQWISKYALSSHLKNAILFFFNFKYVYLTAILSLTVHIFFSLKYYFPKRSKLSCIYVEITATSIDWMHTVCRQCFTLVFQICIFEVGSISSIFLIGKT